MKKSFFKKIKKQRYNIVFYSILILVLVAVLSFIVGFANRNSNEENVNNNSDNLNTTTIVESTTIYSEDLPFKDKVSIFAQSHNLNTSEWSEDYIKRGEDNPEIQDFLLNYPLKKNKSYDIDLSELKDSKSVPHLIQWDERWGYTEYAGNIFGLSGCGPTCLSMVSIYLTNDTNLTPVYIAEFSKKNGYAVNGNGSAWALISEGSEKLGLNAKELPNVKKYVTDNLKNGNPIICVVGPGNFTKRGHFIVLAGIEDDKIIVNDPNSKITSEKRWDYEKFSSEIKNMWVITKQ